MSDVEISMDEVDRLIHRRAMALAVERRPEGVADAPRVQVLCVPHAGGWAAKVLVHLGEQQLLSATTNAADPTAALRAMPARLAELIENARMRLQLALATGREGVADLLREDAEAAREEVSDGKGKRGARRLPARSS